MFTLNCLKDLVRQVCDQMEHSTMPVVKINNRFQNRTIARATWDISGDKPHELIEFNSRALKLPIDQLLDLVRHEVMHLVMKMGDEEPEFQMACRLSGISLSGEDGVSIGQSEYKYQIVCSNCKEVLKRYKRLAGHAKKISDGTAGYGCKICDTVDTLFVEVLKGGQ